MADELTVDGCYFHGKEPIPDPCYRVCGECGHAYATPEALLEVEAETIAGYNAIMPRGEQLAPSISAEDIDFCPLCTHDW